MNTNLRRMAGVFFTIFAIPVIFNALFLAAGSDITLEEYGFEVLMRGFVAIIAFVIACFAIASMYNTSNNSERTQVYTVFLAAYVCYLVTLTLPTDTAIFDVSPVAHLLKVIFIIVFPIYILIDMFVEWLSNS